ncbi:hypothetical protein CENSYa_0672 [Cenarchaeum symbiosum A]|uniref:Uncharacterized protein n=1 Tax=Cenarchaeum symbiosum (strain A) TaxID=414004 RepID=A0RVD8_CENSY|nr:hypothetical protein CENSYa_0672 [Cenarchaeum symbiosum A]
MGRLNNHTAVSESAGRTFGRPAGLAPRASRAPPPDAAVLVARQLVRHKVRGRYYQQEDGDHLEHGQKVCFCRQGHAAPELQQNKQGRGSRQHVYQKAFCSRGRVPAHASPHPAEPCQPDYEAGRGQPGACDGEQDQGVHGRPAADHRPCRSVDDQCQQRGMYRRVEQQDICPANVEVRCNQRRGQAPCGKHQVQQPYPVVHHTTDLMAPEFLQHAAAGAPVMPLIAVGGTAAILKPGGARRLCLRKMRRTTGAMSGAAGAGS